MVEYLSWVDCYGRRLDKLRPELPTFEEYLEQGNWGELYGGAATKGPPYPWREGTEKTYLKKFHEQLTGHIRRP